jgi:transcriptional regulator with XRE-family HTH domain
MSTDYARALGARLRAIRLQQGLSLHGVEQKSQGRWKAVVVGSYERGDRAVAVQRLSELADFYGVPIVELLPEVASAEAPMDTQRIVLDLERLSQIPAEQAGPLARFAGALQRMRGDYNGRVLSVRADDLQTLSLVYDRSPADLLDLLAGWGVVRR